MNINEQLLEACRLGDLKEVIELINHKDINVNVRDQEGQTVLMIAYKFGHPEIVKLFLSDPFFDLNSITQFHKMLVMKKNKWKVPLDE